MELEALEAEVLQGRAELARRRQTLTRLRDSFRGGADAATPERAVAGYEQAELALSSRERLAGKRREALAAATAQLESAHGQKDLLEGRIDALAAQARLIEVTSAGSDAGLALDRSAFDRTQRLVGGLQKRLDVAERVLAKRGVLAPEPAAVEGPSDLLARVNALLAE